MSNIQSVIFDKKIYDKKRAERWLKRNGFRTSYYNKSPYTQTTNFLRYRQFTPSKYPNYYTINKTKGIKYIMGR